MNFRSYFFFLLILVFIGWCSVISNRDYTPKSSSKNETKEVKIEPEPIFISYADSGRVKKYFDKNWNVVHYKEKAAYYRVANYLNGEIIPNELVTDYYINGTIQFEGYLSSENPDVNNGNSKWYDEKGRVSSIRNYSHGILNGEYLEFYETGNLKLKLQYVDGELLGDYIEYYNLDGKIKSKGWVSNQSYNGEYKSFFQNGNLKSEGYYQDGTKEGYFTEYSISGLVVKSEYYHDNELHGEYAEFFNSGDNKVFGHYSKGEPSGSWFYFDEDGDYKKYQYITYRVGAICNDGSRSYATGRGACSWHGGVRYWLTESQKKYINGTGKYEYYTPYQ